MPGFNPNLKICGRCYHRIGSLTADAGEQRKFAQFYIHDNDISAEQEASGRLAAQRDASGMDKGIILELQEWLKKNNPYVKDFKMLGENPELFKDFQMVLKKDAKKAPNQHKGTMHLPTCDEVALITLDDIFLFGTSFLRFQFWSQ